MFPIAAAGQLLFRKFAGGFVTEELVNEGRV